MNVIRQLRAGCQEEERATLGSQITINMMKRFVQIIKVLVKMMPAQTAQEKVMQLLKDGVHLPVSELAL